MRTILGPADRLMSLRCEIGSEPIPGYRLLDRLGGGGFGEVWSAQAPDGTLRAIKIVHGDLATAGDRTAEPELHALRRVLPVRHPFLLPVERYEVIDGRLVIVTPLADGDLAGRFQDCRDLGLPGIPRDELLTRLLEAAEALDALRAANLQHLDVKPQNILLVDGHVAVGDFGLVRDLRSGRPGAGASPDYAAPETIAGALSPHCDQYSLAIVYQELLTGNRPFLGTTSEQLANQHLTVTPNLSFLPEWDRETVGRALAKDSTARFASCAAFIQTLREPIESRIGARRASRRSIFRFPKSVIQPAVIIGIGGVGGSVLGQLRQRLVEEIGSGEQLPVRLLYIETDSEAAATAIESGELQPAEVLPIRLQRAENYARLLSDLHKSTPMPWLDPDWLERLADAAKPDGCRGLGRLAFADHLRALGQKIEADLVAVGRANSACSPRVIIVAGLAGGTGSGMAIDLAFLARPLLSKFGGAADLAGWFLLPAPDADEQAIVNAFAFLTELRYFARPDTTYRARCDEPLDALKTREAPFTDVVVLPLDNNGMESATDGLIRELLASPGDSSSEMTAHSDHSECRTFGQRRYVWPRHAIIQIAARRLAAELLQRWTAVDANEIGISVRQWVAQQWTALELGPEALSKRFQAAATAALGRSVEDAVAALVGPIAFVRPDAIPAIVAGLDKLFARVESALAAATNELLQEWGTRLARPAVTLIEQPGFRLRGADAAVRLLAEQIERARALTAKAAEEWSQRADSARASAATTIAVQSYPRWRYQGLLMRQVTTVYTALHNQLPDQIAEIELCRSRLMKVLGALRKNVPSVAPMAELLLPAGCATPADAAARIATGAHELVQLDRLVQQHLVETGGGLARTCLTTSELTPSLGSALTELAETLLASQLGLGGATELFLIRYPGEEANKALAAAWQAAKPSLAAQAGQAEVTTVAAPLVIAERARQVFGADVQTTNADEIIVRRTVPRLPLAALPQLGPAAQAIYQRRKAAGDSPHSRVDLIVWQKD